MTIANSVISLALRAAGLVGVGQTALAEDANDALVLLNAMIGQWQHQRIVAVIPGALDTFPSLHTDVPSWTGNENVLLVSLAARLRAAYGLPPDEALSAGADAAVKLLQANNLHQQPPDVAGLPTTVGHAIRLALRFAGRVTDAQGVADTSQDMADGLALLVGMLAQWQRKRLLVPDLVELAITSTGAASYTIGPAGDFVAPRPDRIDYAFARLLNSGSNPVDLSLSIIGSREDYAGIALKGLATFPAALWYDATWPAGVLHFWPIPAAGDFDLHVGVKDTLPAYAAPTDALGLPPEYLEAVVTNLAMRLLAANGQQASVLLAGQARASLATLYAANAQIPELGMPAGLAGRRGSSVAAGGSRAFISGQW